MTYKKGYILLSFFFLTTAMGFSQQVDTLQRFQVAVFTPLYLDSAFDEFSNYKHGMNFPKFINPGLEFYEGVEMAIDSLDSEGVPLDVMVYDSRSQQSSIQFSITQPAFDSIDLIIGHVNGNESRILANEAAKRNIPFINATYPNDAGVSNNPNYVILNSTLLTHCSAMYRFIQKNHALAPIVMFRKKGQEDRLQQYFADITKNTNSVPLKIKYVTLDDSFDAEDLREHLTEGRATVCIAGSLDVNFGNNLVQHLSTLYAELPSVVFAMPTWWDVTDFTKPEYQKVEVIYTTPFYLSPTSPLVIKIENEFRSRFYSRPTDMVFRGYETLYHFAHLLHANGKNIGAAFSDNRFRLFNDFQIQPVLDPKTTTLDYFENKKIYFIKKVDGVVTAVY